MSAPLGPAQAAVRLAVYRAFADTGIAPALPELADAAGLEEAAVRAVLRELEALHALALDPADGSVAMAHPFSAVPTPFAVETDRTRYYANCAWDALAMPALLDADSRIDAACAQSAEPMWMRADADGSGLDGPGATGVVHLAVPFRRFWDDVFFT